MKYFCVVALFLWGALFRQESENFDFWQVFGLPPFTFLSMQQPTADTSRAQLEIHLGLVNDILQFVRQDDGTYEAAYEITLDLLDSSGTILTGSVTTHHIRVADFNESNSRQYYHHHPYRFIVRPGHYSIHLEIMDLETRKRLEQQQELLVKDFSPCHLQISSIRLLRRGDDDSLHLNLAQIYARQEEDAHIRFRLSGLQRGQPLRLHYAFKNWHDEEVMSWDEELVATANQMSLEKGLRDRFPDMGNFSLEVTVEQQDTSVTEQCAFAVQYQPAISNGRHEWSLQKDAYGAMRYVCDKDFYAQLEKAGAETRQQMIEAFWRERDPTPGTLANELRAEFIRRVQFANRHFSVLALRKQGWQTDRGRLYIRNGPPTWVRTIANDIGAPPIEVWYYSSVDVRYVFRDKKGNTDYKLIHEE